MISRSSVPHNRTLYRVAERPMPFGGLRGDGYEGALYGKEGRHVDRALRRTPIRAAVGRVTVA
jgi:hypothetical protein